MDNLFTARLVNGPRRLLNDQGGWYRKRQATTSPGAERDQRHAPSR